MDDAKDGDGIGCGEIRPFPGYDVILLEQSPALGGRVARFNRYFPKLCHPSCGLEINYQRIRKNPRNKVITMARVESLSGQAGDYCVSVKTRPRYVNQKCTACGDCAKATDDEGRALIDADLTDGSVNQPIIAACSPRVMTDRFTFDGATAIRANLREQVTWSRPAVRRQWTFKVKTSCCGGSVSVIAPEKPST